MKRRAVWKVCDHTALFKSPRAVTPFCRRIRCRSGRPRRLRRRSWGRAFSRSSASSLLPHSLQKRTRGRSMPRRQDRRAAGLTEASGLGGGRRLCALRFDGGDFVLQCLDGVLTFLNGLTELADLGGEGLALLIIIKDDTADSFLCLGDSIGLGGDFAVELRDLDHFVGLVADGLRRRFQFVKKSPFILLFNRKWTAFICPLTVSFREA